MTGKKSSREKRRKRSGQEAVAALAAPDLVPAVGSSGSGSTSGCGSASGCGSVTCCGNTSVSGSVTGGGNGSSCWGGSSVERGERRKRRSTDSSSSVAGSLQQETKYLLPPLEKELFLAEHSDLEEGGLDLTVALKPVSFYISDKKEMLRQCFCIIGEKKLQKMLPDVLKPLHINRREILIGTFRSHDSFPFCVCVTGKGEDSDVLSINADAYDSDIEGPCNEEAAAPEVPENTVQSEAGQIDDLEKDIEKSVNEILGLAECSPKEPKAATLTVPPPEDVQPSAQQLELLELEMRARAIKALMKAGDIKKPA
ncbi:hypothetical protein FD754_010688 [Muntiacus muntjak]|uniref:Caspase activity and apoptosis inhibitor 1 n=1 Tax=Muntiacus muntjak TaxID=9888 RepID=A0A5N3WXC6_MUNMU|nr:hypothetical protein FD754_010688 [Muntiacus muntjak]